VIYINERDGITRSIGSPASKMAVMKYTKGRKIFDVEFGHN
jgi:hypothetical protein